PATVLCPLSLHDALPISVDELHRALGTAEQLVDGRRLVERRHDGLHTARGIDRRECCFEIELSLGVEPAGGMDLPAHQADGRLRSEEHTSELQSQSNLVC